MRRRAHRIPRRAVRDTAGARPCPASPEPGPVPVSLVHAGERLLPIKLRAFLDFAAPRLRKVLAAVSG